MPKDGAALRRVVVASLIGATVEWYDFFLYGVVAGIVLNKLYFPAGDPVVGTLLAYATFAVGFLARPFGGVLFGHFGDRVGRKSMLVLTLMVMGVATVLIGLVPTYAQIGLWAPAILLLLRVMQGIGLGGEWGGAVLMTFEYAEPNSRGLYASLPQIGLAIGLCLASGIVALLSYVLSDEQFLSWGWRVAFMLSFVLVLIGLYIRLNILETPEFTKLKESRAEVRLPFATMLADFPKRIVAGMGARYIDGVFFNIFGVFTISYLTQQLAIPRTQALLGVSAAAIIMCAFIPLFGYISDRVGRTRTYFWGSLVTGFSALPAFFIWATHPESAWLVWSALIIPFGIFYASIYGPEAALFCELFDARVRYTGISFVYQFSGIFASGLTPIIATWFIQLFGPHGGAWAIACYCAFAGTVSALSALWIRRLMGRRMEEGAPRLASAGISPSA
jgi:MHS family shikimate/dehydroshikimate transporter-like MFS transporter